MEAKIGKSLNELHLTECPRDAMQGIQAFIPTPEKIDYLNLLLQVGFKRLDAGSFVSAKAIPQMADTAEVLTKLDRSGSTTELLCIVANARGAADAAAFGEVDFLGYPFSVSETFQQRNTHAGIQESIGRLDEIIRICQKNHKKLQVYLSMAFGNPYGDPWSPEIVFSWAEKMKDMGVTHVALADTIGVSDEKSIHQLFSALIPALPELEISAHLHARPEEVMPKARAAWNAGCRFFDTALRGLGGCPMAEDTLTGNMDTESVLLELEAESKSTLNKSALKKASDAALYLFNRYH